MNKKILFVTGTRADYSKLKLLAKVSQENNFKTSFYVTGMHVLSKYGLTKVEVHRDGYDEVDEFINQNSKDPQSHIIGKTICAFTDFLEEKSPDLVVVHGDRPEAFACAIAAATNYYKLLHVEGGEISGSIDESFRHAISKLASIHCVSSDKAIIRLKNMGEDPKTIFNIGSPELETHLNTDPTKIENVKDRYDINFDEYGIVMFYPVTSEISTIGTQTQNLFKSLERSNKKFVVISPNNDPGVNIINGTIDRLSKKQFRVLPSMRFEFFSILMKNSGAIIGNSSTGVREAPFLGIPSLNIGSRQNERANSNSITNANSEDHYKINKFLSEEWYKRYDKSSEFGSGNTESKFKDLLLSNYIWNVPDQKYFFK